MEDVPLHPPTTSEAFRAQFSFQEYLVARAIVPELGETWEITKESVTKTGGDK